MGEGGEVLERWWSCSGWNSSGGLGGVAVVRVGFYRLVGCWSVGDCKQ